jgi:hypothetical protein
MITTIQFTDVGRDKKSWSKTFNKDVTTDMIEREAKSGGGLLSREVDAELNEDLASGTIFVGGFRAVGTFKIVES